MSDTDRRLRILARLTEQRTEGMETEQLCSVSADVTGMSGAGIMLMANDRPWGSLCTTDAVSARIEELQYALSDGPCIDAYHQDRPVLEPDLAHPATARWPAFTPPAVDVGVRAVFGFPLRIGAISLGALNLYRVRAGSLTHDQHVDAVVVADIATRAILRLQAEAPPGTLSADLEAGADFPYAVHQASGMIAVQLDVGLRQALLRLKAHAFSHDLSLSDVANDVVARRLRFADEPREERGPS